MNTLANLVRVNTSTIGTGTITLGAAVTGLLTFAQGGITNGQVVTYAISDGANSEIGQGTYTAAGTLLSRDVVYRSTGAGNTAKISLSGTAQVAIVIAAEDIGATAAGSASLVLRDTSAAYDVTVTATSSPILTAGRALVIDMENVDHTLHLGTTAGDITIPTGAAVTLAATNVAQTWSAAQTALTLAGITTLPGTSSISSTGQLLIGGGAVATGGTVAGIQANGTSHISIARFSTDANQPRLTFGKSRGTATAAAAIAAGDFPGSIMYVGDDGSTNGGIPILGAEYRVVVDAPVSTGIVPMRQIWLTMNAGGTFAERMRLSSAGGLNLGATTDPGAQNLSVAGTIAPVGGILPAFVYSVSPRLCHTGGIPGHPATGAFTAQTPVITEFYMAEIFIPANCTVTGVAVYNSATISGNLKVGLFAPGGGLLATSASTAMAGTNVFQRVPFTGTYAALGPATYFVAVFYDNTTVRPWTHTVGSFGASRRTGQDYATGFTTGAVPTTFTTALGPVASLY